MFIKFNNDEAGQSTVEYGLIISLVGFAGLLAASSTTSRIMLFFTTANDLLPTAVPAG